MLAALLFGTYRRRVLGLLLLHPEESFHVRELARRTGTAAGTLHRELAQLAEAGLLSREKVGNQLRYRANRECPIFAELASIFRKTSGLGEVLLEALAPLAPRIELALVFGSVARGEERVESDVDLLIVGDVDFGEVVRALYAVQEEIRREVNPVVMSKAELQRRISDGDSFLHEILSRPTIGLIGNQRELGKSGSH